MSTRTAGSVSADDSEWLTTEELATLLKVPVPTVRAWRHNGSGPEGVRLGRHVRYRRDSVGAWISANEQAQRRRLQ
jgi:excisionase family DNA binding protein